MALTYTWNTITTGQTDADSPINQVLMDALRENVIHNYEYLGGNTYTPAEDHDHDGTNSKLVTSVADGVIAQAKLKNTFGTVQTTSGNIASLTLPGGFYGFFPKIAEDTASTASWGYDHTAAAAKWAAQTASATYAALVAGSTTNPGVGSLGFRQYYVQASPPYLIGDIEWGHFLFLLRNRNGDIISGYEAPDPPWAYNGLAPEETDQLERIKVIPHPFADYFTQDPDHDGLEIVLVDIREIDVEPWRRKCNKARKLSIISDLDAANISPPTGARGLMSLDGLPTIPGFSDKIKIKRYS
jgi:hypothetical protein